ncbi:MAG: polyribonucleotide nucleotidyltransferase, partial [Chloroflexi bacterium]
MAPPRPELRASGLQFRSKRGIRVAIVTKSRDFEGRHISIETGRVAEQANGAVIIRQGDSIVLSTCVMSAPREGIDFFPLTCDYEEKMYAAGKIPGGFIRREGRPTESAILASRLTDRPLRPLFPDGFKQDISVVGTVLSVDQESDPVILAINGASAALTISDIPFQGPVGAVRVGYLDGRLVLNPALSKMEESELDLVVAGTSEAILMVEAGAKGVSEQLVVDALALAHERIKELCALQNELREAAGRGKLEFTSPSYPEEISGAVSEYLASRLDAAAYEPDKKLRETRVAELRGQLLADLGERFPEQVDILKIL